MVDGAALEKRQWLSLLVPSDTISCHLVYTRGRVYIWQCHPVPLGAKQYGGKMSAKMEDIMLGFGVL